MKGNRILPCKCESTFQDKEYGQGNRLFNKGKRGATGYVYHCTVCGQKQTVPMMIEINTKTGEICDVREVI